PPAHPPHGTRRPPGAAPPVRLGVSGSGAELLVLAWSAADLARERVAGTRVLARLGVAPGMRVANTLPGALATPGSLLLGDVVEELSALDVPLGAVEDAAAARQAWDLVERVTPDVIVLDDATTATFLAAAPPAERPWWRGIVWLRVGACAARPALPAAAGFAGWQREWLAVKEAIGLPRLEAKNTIDGYLELVREGVLCVIGPLITDNSIALAPVIDQAGVPAVTWTGTDRYHGEYCFNLGNGGLAEEAAMMAAWIRRQGHRTVGMIHELSPGGVEYASNFRYYAARAGLDVLI